MIFLSDEMLFTDVIGWIIVEAKHTLIAKIR
ncbi:Uncharacterised protein [Vibrio cholerae]|nr:Uncharacterised protein [Vibrio cholerae]CSD92665.1 Uncharacterised protein [Vibrio cholerae]CSI71747.1 Uncharacterised protein [Vibrio cholerae]